MPLMPLNQLSAFSSGADLWICPDLIHSQWTQEIDWALNHQIRRSETHQLPALSPEIKGLLYENEIPLPTVTTPSRSLMITTQMQLPNRWILILPWEGHLGKWCSKALSTWEGLKSPSLRFFLPKGITTSEFANEWQKITEQQDLTLVLDKD